jgi:site-specific recombinase XerC
VTAPGTAQEGKLPCSTDLTKDLFTLAEARRILDDPVLDKRYQQTPLGARVARFMDYLEVECGLSPESLRDYEPPCAWLAIDNPTLDILDFTPPAGIELCRQVMKRHYTVTPKGTPTTPRTKKKIRSIWVTFFDWGIEECGLLGNPARALKIPKQRDPERKTFSEEFVQFVLDAQDYLADWLMAFLILRYGLRRSGILNIQLGHFDHDQMELTVHTKGGRIDTIPIVEKGFWRRLREFQAGLELPDDVAVEDVFLIYRQDTRFVRVALEEAEELRLIGGDLPAGYSTVTTRKHSDKRPSPQTVHRWWYRCLVRAGLVPEGTTSGANMHRGRHTAGRDLQRSSGNLKLTQRLLLHRDIRTTSIYAEMDTSDLAEALRAMDRDDE